ncbi:MAG: hypothetical protein ACHQ6U_10065 [Thermodesulfobacteriota bacterium]
MLLTFFVQSGNDGGLTQIVGGETIQGTLDEGINATLTEEETSGWVLANNECNIRPGVSATEIEGVVKIECITGGEEAFIDCTFTNMRAVLHIPTLSVWGMIAAAAGLGLIGVFFAVRKRRIGRA